MRITIVDKPYFFMGFGQLADSADLLVCWKATGDEDAIDIEHQIIAEFKTIYGSFPLANWKG